MTDDPDLTGPPAQPAAQALLHCDRCGQRTAHDASVADHAEPAPSGPR